MSCNMAFGLENPSRRNTQNVNAIPAAPPAATSWVRPNPASATLSEYQNPTGGGLLPGSVRRWPLPATDMRNAPA